MHACTQTKKKPAETENSKNEANKHAQKELSKEELKTKSVSIANKIETVAGPFWWVENNFEIGFKVNVFKGLSIN